MPSYLRETSPVEFGVEAAQFHLECDAVRMVILGQSLGIRAAISLTNKPKFTLEFGADIVVLHRTSFSP